jgi:hypothetical protein
MVNYKIYTTTYLTSMNIIRTIDEDIIFNPNKSNKIHCHVGTDFSGLFGVEDGLKPICATSRTGYVIKFCDVVALYRVCN